MRTNDIRRVSREHSFTLVETVVAVGLLAFLLLQVVGVQGNAIYAGEYGRNSMQAAWLAKRIMAQVEYQVTIRDFKDLKEQIKDQPFDDMKEFSYSLTIEEFKLPIEDMIMGSMGGDDDKSYSEGQDSDGGEGAGAALAGFAEGPIKQCLGDERLKTAVVEVTWPVGARRDSVGLAMLLTNQKKIEECLGTLKATMPATGPGGAGAGPGSGGTPRVEPTPAGT